MSESPRDLLGLYFDDPDAMTEAQAAALAESLRTDVKLRAEFTVQAALADRLSGTLAAERSATAFTDALHERLTADRDADFAEQVKASVPAEPTIPIYRKGYEPQPFKLRPHHYALAAAVLLVACGVAVYLLAFNAPVDPQPDPSLPGPAVATLIESSGGGNLRTPHGYPAEGDDYSAGDYALTSGKAEFMLTNSVNVTLRGETRMHMRNNMNVALTRGSAEFVVPTGAVGFTVHLPDGARVVDLGTRFTVTLDEEDGSTRITVLEGEVAIDESDLPERHTVIAPHAVRIADGRIQRVKRIDLADVVGGGDGSGNGKDAGVRLADGKSVSTHRQNASAGVAANKFVPADHPFIDGVFVPDGKDRIAAVQVTTTGVFATNLPDTDGASWDEIWNGHNAMVATSISAEFDSVIGMHCNKGITFELDAVRAVNSELQIDRVEMSAAVGNTALGGSIIVLIDGNERARHTLTQPNTSQPIAIDLKPTDRFLTIIAVQGERSGDWLFIGDPTLHLSAPLTETKAETVEEQGAPVGQLSTESERTQTK